MNCVIITYPQPYDHRAHKMFPSSVYIEDYSDLHHHLLFSYFQNPVPKKISHSSMNYNIA